MRTHAAAVFLSFVLIAGCGDAADVQSRPAPADLAAPPAASPDGGALPDGAAVDLDPAPDLPAGGGRFTVLGAGLDFRDASVDQGGNVWGVTGTRVYLFAAGGAVHTYDSSSGLAQGHATWTDSYWCQGSPPCPVTSPVVFSAVAGGRAGEAFVGNLGYLGDRLSVDSASGAVRFVEGLTVSAVQQSDPVERAAQQQREVATWRAVVDLAGTFGGTAYFGGWHGTSALHGMAEDRAGGACGCPDFEEHVHPFSVGGNDVFGGDVHAAFVTAAGDLWLGDRLGIYKLPQRSRGAGTDLFVDFAALGPGGAQYLDVFPGVDDWNFGVAEDARGGVWVASYGHGLAYLAPGGFAPTYFNTAGGQLPTDALTGLALDGAGDVWLATDGEGVLRLHPGAGAFTRYAAAEGLPSNRVRQVQLDAHHAGGALYFATAGGIAVYRPE